MGLKLDLTARYAIREHSRVVRGHFGPVGMGVGGWIYGTYVLPDSGESRLARISEGGEVEILARSESFAEASVGAGLVVGSMGYGERAFCFDSVNGLRLLGKDEFSSASCVDSDGNVGGAIVADGQERGVIWLSKGEVADVFGVRFVSALGQGNFAGSGSDGRVIVGKVGEKEFRSVGEGTGRAVGFLPTGETVLNVRKDGRLGIEVIGESSLVEVGFGGANASAVAVSEFGEILFHGVDEAGILRYGVWSKGDIAVLDTGVKDGLAVKTLNGFGVDGMLVGSGMADGVQVLIVGIPVSDGGDQAVILA